MHCCCGWDWYLPDLLLISKYICIINVLLIVYLFDVVLYTVDDIV